MHIHHHSSYASSYKVRHHYIHYPHTHTHIHTHPEKPDTSSWLFGFCFYLCRCSLSSSVSFILSWILLYPLVTLSPPSLFVSVSFWSCLLPLLQSLALNLQWYIKHTLWSSASAPSLPPLPALWLASSRGWHQPFILQPHSLLLSPCRLFPRYLMPLLSSLPSC